MDLLPDRKDHEDSVRNWFVSLEKTIRAHRLYTSDHQASSTFEERLHQELRELLDHIQELTIGVLADGFEWNEKLVYSAEDRKKNFAYSLYQDGIRQLTFLYGISLEELRTFLSISKVDFESYEHWDDDSVTLLWKANLHSIRYVSVETFSSVNTQGKSLQELIDDQMKEMTTDTQKTSKGFLESLQISNRKRRIKANDVQEIINLPDLSTQDVSYNPKAVKNEIQVSLQNDENKVFQRMLLILFRVLVQENRAKDFFRVSSTLERIFETFLHTQDFEMAAKLLTKVRELSTVEGNPSDANAKLMGELYLKLHEKDQLRTVLDELDSLVAKYGVQLPVFLSSLHSDFIRKLFNIYQKTENERLRGCLSRAFVPRLTELFPLFRESLRNSNPNVVVRSLEVMETWNRPEGYKAVFEAFTHPNPSVRLKVWMILERSQTEYLAELMGRGLYDPDPKIRNRIVHFVGENQIKSAAKPLFSTISEPQFDERKLDEKKTYYIALAKIAGSEVFPFLRDELERSVFERSHAVMDRQLCAIAGLEILGTPEAIGVLTQQMDRTLVSSQIREACRRAIKRMHGVQKDD